MASTLSLTDLRKMQPADLEKDLRDKKAELAKIRIDIGMMSQKDTSRHMKVKKDIARMLTVLNEKKGEGKTLKNAEKTATVRAPRASKKASEGSSSTSK